jgi:hypothetical protein
LNHSSLIPENLHPGPHPQEERDAFEEFDKTAGVRKAMVAKLEEEFKDLKLKYSIGGQISFDVFPIGCVENSLRFEVLLLGV